MKRLGFLTGAVLAAIGVFLFNQWRDIDDDDRLTEILVDHCLPYVQTGAIPFQTLGRSPGVFDDVLPNEQLQQDGGARLIYDLRFVAHWGVSSDFENSARVCLVQPTYNDGTVPLFATDTTDLIQRYTNRVSQLGALTTDQVAMGGDLTTFVWQDADTDGTTGLRVALLAGRGAVSNVVVIADITTE